MTYTVIKKEYVIESLGKGKTVYCVDFKGMRVMDCGNMTISTIRNFIDSADSVFYMVTSAS